jgi:hypothetical protein
LCFDLLIIAALCKEILAWVKVHALNEPLFLTVSLALPFFLGVAPGEPGLAAIVRDPIRSLIRNGVALTSLLLYWQIQMLAGTIWQFGVVYTVMVGLYLLGRTLGLVWRAMWFFIALLLAAYLYLNFAGGQAPGQP